MDYTPHPITDQLDSANQAMHDLEMHLIAHGNGTFPPGQHPSGRVGHDTAPPGTGGGWHNGLGGSGGGSTGGNGGSTGGSTSGGHDGPPTTQHGGSGGSGYSYPHLGAPRLQLGNWSFPKLGNVPIGASQPGQSPPPNPAVIIIILGGIAVGGYFLWHKLHQAHADEHELDKKGE